MDNDIICVDLQGFKNNSNHFIVKELAIVFNNNECINFIIRPPFHFECLSLKKQREANWLTRHYHHLDWSDGTVTYQSVCKFLQSNTRHSKVYTKGEEKVKCLNEMTRHHQTIFNAEDIGCISFKQIENKYSEYFYCNYHRYGVCALRNAFLLSKEISLLL